MNNAQRLELRSSEIRTRLNELSGIDALTDEQRSEIDALANEYSDIERQKRAAIIAQDSDGSPENEPVEPDSETRELDGLIQRAELRSYLIASAQDSHVTGAERELREAAFGISGYEDYIPLDILNPIEQRADAATNVADSIATSQQNITGRIFAQTAGNYLGVERPSVGVGEQTYITLTGGATADVRSDGVAKDAEAATFTTTSVEPVRLTTRYLFGVETTARIQGFEDALRTDLRSVLGDKLDSLAINGQAAVANVSPAVAGIISALSAPTTPTAETTWNGYLALYPDRVDGKTSMDGSNVRLLVNPETYKHANGLQIETSGELLSSVLPTERFRASANLPSAVSGVASAISYTAGYRGLVQPVWRGMRVIRDVYSNASQGQIALTIIMLTGAVMAQAEPYRRLAIKITP